MKKFYLEYTIEDEDYFTDDICIKVDEVCDSIYGYQKLEIGSPITVYEVENGVRKVRAQFAFVDLSRSFSSKISNSQKARNKYCVMLGKDLCCLAELSSSYQAVDYREYEEKYEQLHAEWLRAQAAKNK